MSIASMATGDTVVPQVESTEIGEGGGLEFSHTDGTALDCLVQTMSADEDVRYAARGQRNRYVVFFASNPGLSQDDRIKWTHQGGNAFASAKYLRVLDQYSEGRPGAGNQMLWIVDAEESTTRQEQ